MAHWDGTRFVRNADGAIVLAAVNAAARCSTRRRSRRTG